MIISNKVEIQHAMPLVLKELPVPQATASYQPVGHLALIDYLRKKVEQKGFLVDQLTVNHAAKGNKMVGTIRLTSPSYTHEDFSMTLGFRNSYDKSMSLGVGVGAEVIVCANGMFLADVQQLRKHTSNVATDIHRIVDKQINYMEKMFGDYAEDVEVLKSKEITQNTMNEIVGGMFMEHELITGAQLSIIRREISISDNFKMLGSGGNMSLWNLYQNTTEALKKSHVTKYFSDHAKAREIILDYA